MDMNADSKVLRSLSNGLKNCRTKLNGASSSMRSFNTALSADLEGQQYMFSEEATDESCSAIDISCANLNALASFLERMATDVEEYCACKYNGAKK